MKTTLYFLITLVSLSGFLYLMTDVAQAQSQGPSIKFEGYTQMTATKFENNKAFVFGFERVRLGAKGKLNQYADYRLMVDFVESGIGKDGETPAMINYAQLTFKPSSKINITAGKFKTPVGMEWNTSATSLDFVKRGLSQSLVFHWDMGFMLHASGIGNTGFGYNLGVFNAGPNKANNVGDPELGQDYTIAGSININPVKAFYLEASFGSALTSDSLQENVNIFGLGARFKVTDQLSLKGEYLSRSDEQNSAVDGSDLNFQAGYLVHPNFEPVIRYDVFDVKNDDKDQKLITAGLNIFINPDNQKETKIQINYLASDLEDGDSFQILLQSAF